MASLSGDVGTLPGLPEASIDMSFRDILRNLDFAAFVAGEAQHGDFFLLGDISYAKISDSASTPGNLFSNAKLTSATFTGTAAAGYTFYRGESFQAGAFGGARIWSLDNELKLGAGVLPAAKTSETKTFVDPIVGLSGRYQLAPRWALAGSASVGGFGAAADFEWGFTTTVAYEAGESWGLVAGFRFLSVDYDRNGFLYDVDQYGPVLGAHFRF